MHAVKKELGVRNAFSAITERHSFALSRKVMRSQSSGAAACLITQPRSQVVRGKPERRAVREPSGSSGEDRRIDIASAYERAGSSGAFDHAAQRRSCVRWAQAAPPEFLLWQTKGAAR